MRQQQGQATVEWVAVLLISGLLAVSMTVGMRGLSARFAGVAASLDAIASAGADQATVPQPPVLAMASLPVLDGRSIVAVASQLVAAGIAERPPGSNRGPGIDAFTEGHAEAWCADFVSWVLRAAGQPFTGGPSSGWRLAWTGDVRSWFVARAAFRNRLDADPQPGDVVWFIHGHVGIVEAVRGDVLATIEGNSSDAVVRKAYDHWRLNSDIGGFGRPGVVGVG